MPKNPKRPVYWEDLLDLYEAGTDKTQKQFAEQHGVNLHTFKHRLYLRRKARRQNDPTTDLIPFLELSAPTPNSAPIPELSSLSPSPAAALLLPNEVTLHFHSLPDPRYFALLLNSLRGV